MQVESSEPVQADLMKQNSDIETIEQQEPAHDTFSQAEQIESSTSKQNYQQDNSCTNNSIEQIVCDSLTDNNNNNQEIWTTREKLLLISFALINGDSNWSYVCDQLNKLNQNSTRKKTASQCSKQYRQIIKTFLNKSQDLDAKNQIIDLK